MGCTGCPHRIDCHKVECYYYGEPWEQPAPEIPREPLPEQYITQSLCAGYAYDCCNESRHGVSRGQEDFELLGECINCGSTSWTRVPLGWLGPVRNQDPDLGYEPSDADNAAWQDTRVRLRFHSGDPAWAFNVYPFTLQPLTPDADNVGIIPGFSTTLLMVGGVRVISYCTPRAQHA